jgi:hypothetical protein
MHPFSYFKRETACFDLIPGPPTVKCAAGVLKARSQEFLPLSEEPGQPQNPSQTKNLAVENLKKSKCELGSPDQRLGTFFPIANCLSPIGFPRKKCTRRSETANAGKTLCPITPSLNTIDAPIASLKACRFETHLGVDSRTDRS